MERFGVLQRGEIGATDRVAHRNQRGGQRRVCPTAQEGEPRDGREGGHAVSEIGQYGQRTGVQAHQRPTG